MSKRPPINKKSGIALKQLINKMGFLSNAELARSTGIDKGSLSKLFNGQTGRPTVPNTLKIVNACAAKSDRALPEVLIEIIKIYDKSNYSFTPEEKKHLNKCISSEAISNNFLAFKTWAPDTIPRHNLPTPNYTNLIGREEELTQLLQILSKNCPYHRVIILGLGGVGKTSLVLEAAYRCLQNKTTFGAIIFTSAQESHLTCTGMETWLQRESTLEDVLEVIKHTLKYLDEQAIKRDFNLQLRYIQEKLRQQKTLLILDNLETFVGIERLRSFIYCLPSTVKVIITTQQQILLDAAITIVLQPLLVEDALCLLQHLSTEKRLQLNQEECQKVLQKTSCIPATMVYTIGQLASMALVNSMMN